MTEKDCAAAEYWVDRGAKPGGEDREAAVGQEGL